MRREIKIDNVTYICNVTYRDNTEFWSCSNAKAIAAYLHFNGAEIERIITDCVPNRIEVDKSHYWFESDRYKLNQCEGDLFEWFMNIAEIGDFTYYFDKIVFHTQNGFVGAYRDDITNIIKL